MLRSVVRSFIATVALAAAASPALAQSASGDKAAANALFDEGKRLLAAGDTAQACAKFEASIKVLDQLGTRLNLADCYERAGRTASAWAEFREAGSLAEKRGDARSKFARDRAEALRPRLVKLSITVPPGSRLAGLEIKRNGVAVSAALYDTSVPIDPGKYTIEAAATGRQPWSTTIDASTAGAELKIEVPKLDASAPVKSEPVVPPPIAKANRPATGKSVPPAKSDSAAVTADVDRRSDAPVDSPARRKRHLISYAVGGVGLVGLGVGVVLGYEAKSKWDEAGKHCMGDICDRTGISINRDARSLGTTGTIIGGIGLAAAAAAVVIYVTAPSGTESAAVAVSPRPGGGVVSWTAQF